MRASLISSGSAVSSAVLPRRPARIHSRVYATYNNEAESLYKGIPVQEGIINRRLMQKQMGQENKAFLGAMKLAGDEARREQLLRRESRGAANTNEELVEYFLNTIAEDLEFEVARCRPKLDAGFFKHLDSAIGALRFTEEQGDDTLVELEALRQYLTAAVKMVDEAVEKTSSAKDRVAKLLSSRDKKACILEMAEANEIDQSLMDLLQSNIQAARLAEQEDAAVFMEKVLNACAKFYVAPMVAPLPTLPSAAAAAGKAPAASAGTSMGGIIIPGPSQPQQQQGGGGGSGLIIPGR